MNRSGKLKRLTRALSPSFLRVGGTPANCATFVPKSESRVTSQQDEPIVTPDESQLLAEWIPSELEQEFAKFNFSGKNEHTQQQSITTGIYTRLTVMNTMFFNRRRLESALKVCKQNRKCSNFRCKRNETRCREFKMATRKL